MLIEIKVPSVGESVTEALLAQWFKNDGDPVKKDEPLFVIETDKVTLEVVAEEDGILAIKVPEGDTVAIGAVVGTLDTAAAAAPEATAAREAKPAPAATEKPKATEAISEAEPLATAAPLPQPATPEPAPTREAFGGHILSDQPLAPSVRRLVAEKGLNPALITGTGPNGRITKGDVVLYLESGQAAASSGTPDQAAVSAAAQTPAEIQPAAAMPDAELVNRKPMSPLRQRIATRLLEAKQNTAMLTTFNEIDMSQVMAIRKQYKEAFKRKYQVNLGIMSFFIKASVEALKEIAQINAFVDGKDIIEHHYYHIGVAVGSERGLVVPVIRHADKLSFAGLEQAIVDYVKKINENRLEIADLEGGTFTISNGGVYGSLLSTPILNIPQSAILGMHKIEKRPMVIDDEIVIRPMMYVALSYDHRIVDGREAVTFLKRIKEFVENPERIMMEI
ncbi:MAG: 2-oxoglutarate dehydrogenase complex dihydrolipoyllysine-residue succinyltransferase [Deltaproteobacteria bacterium]|jgi:2-oxoglutarate dehydrogenase E2 component (dihydrolipoamide succinyltransferase)|nr:2-oxoglutarate dehydrogenase complex dihydrolipoyllysine-residue succinyltransferase [Deltaproteobacteria bacterium]